MDILNYRNRELLCSSPHMNMRRIMVKAVNVYQQAFEYVYCAHLICRILDTGKITKQTAKYANLNSFF